MSADWPSTPARGENLSDKRTALSSPSLREGVP